MKENTYVSQNSNLAIIEALSSDDSIQSHSAAPVDSNEHAPEETSLQVHQFVEALYEPSDILEFRILPSRQSRWTTASTLDEVIPWLINQNNDGQSIYVGCNPRSCKGDGSNAQNCTGCGRCTKCVSVYG